MLCYQIRINFKLNAIRIKCFEIIVFIFAVKKSHLFNFVLYRRTFLLLFHWYPSIICIVKSMLRCILIKVFVICVVVFFLFVFDGVDQLQFWVVLFHVLNCHLIIIIGIIKGIEANFFLWSGLSIEKIGCLFVFVFPLSYSLIYIAAFKFWTKVQIWCSIS